MKKKSCLNKYAPTPFPPLAPLTKWSSCHTKKARVSVKILLRLFLVLGGRGVVFKQKFQVISTLVKKFQISLKKLNMGCMLMRGTNYRVRDNRDLDFSVKFLNTTQ